MMAMRVLLVNPWPATYFPLPGLGYIKSFVEARTEGAVRIDLADIGQTLNIAFRSSDTSYDIVGMSVNTFSVRYVPTLLFVLRQAYPDAWFVAGGHHASMLPEQLLSLGLDQVVIGPGEDAFLSIVNGNRDRIVTGVARENLDELPMPDYSGLRGEWLLPDRTGKTALPIISARGCPYGCRFCDSTYFWKRKWHARSPVNVISEIKASLLSGAMECFMFEDDTFTMKKDRAIEICERIERDILPSFPNVRWHAASRTEALVDSDLCRCLVRAGCTYLWLGIESGDAGILRTCGKRTTPETQEEGLKVAHSHGLKTIAQIMVGLIGETQSSIDATRQFIKRTCPTSVSAAKSFILPGTYFHDFAKQRGFKDEEFLTRTCHFTYEHSDATLDRWQAQIQDAATWPQRWLFKGSRLKQKALRAFVSRRSPDAPIISDEWL
jgi:anaerobic magnesium-protoporphyrin IX monomethyl ester cyclase